MSQTARLDAAQLRALALHEGDTLRVLSEDDAGAVVVIERLSPGQPSPRRGRAGEWVRSAKGSVRLPPGKSVDQARMESYAEKHGVK